MTDTAETRILLLSGCGPYLLLHRPLRFVSLLIGRLRRKNVQPPKLKSKDIYSQTAALAALATAGEWRRMAFGRGLASITFHNLIAFTALQYTVVKPHVS